MSRDKKQSDREKWQYILQVARNKSAPARSGAVAAVLANYYNAAKGYAFPSQKTLADGSGLSPRALRNVLAGMVECGHLEIEGKGGIDIGGKGLVCKYYLILRPDNVEENCRVDDSERGRFTPHNVEENCKQRGGKLPRIPLEIPLENPLESGALSADSLKVRQTKRRPSKATAKTSFPDDFCYPTDAELTDAQEATAMANLKIAKACGLSGEDGETAFDKFRAYYLENEKTSANWEESWRKWCIREVEHKRQERAKAKPKNNWESF
jgi:hypothetical protein